uniref:MARVEL domain-containing protein n=1 Tax=Romanomermis culicivorax TaxID=13658 RepID=A0A915HWH9_ROMCU
MLFINPHSYVDEENHPYFTVTRRIVSPGWCVTKMAVLKWLEITCCIIILIVAEPYIFTWSGYNYIAFTCFMCLILTIATMVVFFCQTHRGKLDFLPWKYIEISYDLLAMMLFVFALAVSLYDCINLSEGSQKHHSKKLQQSSLSDLRARVYTITAFICANSIFYFLSAIHAHSSYL